MLTEAERREKIWDIVRVASGNFLEMYDFSVYGYFAIYIARTFFPTGNAFSSLMLSLGTFAAGFLMRPLGGLISAPTSIARGAGSG
jgi:MFS transporter, MHS family, citrate/tricarballylate:H+ symporter